LSEQLKRFRRAPMTMARQVLILSLAAAVTESANDLDALLEEIAETNAAREELRELMAQLKALRGQTRELLDKLTVLRVKIEELRESDSELDDRLENFAEQNAGNEQETEALSQAVEQIKATAEMIDVIDKRRIKEGARIDQLGTKLAIFASDLARIEELRKLRIVQPAPTRTPTSRSNPEPGAPKPVTTR
jgi:ABC-type transporter Mla subunit MlaD